ERIPRYYQKPIILKYVKTNLPVEEFHSSHIHLALRYNWKCTESWTRLSLDPCKRAKAFDRECTKPVHCPAGEEDTWQTVFHSLISIIGTIVSRRTSSN